MPPPLAMVVASRVNARGLHVAGADVRAVFWKPFVGSVASIGRVVMAASD